ncbi:hypothetical protein Tco_1263982, partial [Tanacetum coccineum]
AQLVPKYHPIGRCNNYAVLQSISCSPECKIVGQILLDHPLSYALNATADVPVVVGYQGVVYKVSAFYTKNLAQPWQIMFKKEAIQYPRFIKLIIADLMKKFPNIPKRLEEDYHSIKDDVLLVKAIRDNDDFKQYETVFMKVDVLMNQPRPVVSTQVTHRTTPRAIRSPTVFAHPRERKKRKRIKDDDDSKDRIEPGSHKENPEIVDDDDDKVEEKVEEKKDDDMGSLEIRTQTTIPTPPSSPRKIFSLDKNIDQELTNETHNKVDQVLKEVVPQIAKNATNDLIEYNLKPCIAATIIEDRDAFRSEFEKSSTFKTSCREDVFHSHHDEHQDDDAPPEGEKRVKRYKMKKRSKSARGSLSKHSTKGSTTYVSKQQSQQQEWDAWEEENVIDEDEYGNTEEKKYILSLYKISTEEFPKPDLEEKLNRWVRKEFKTFDEDARITEFVRIITDQLYGLDFIEQILVMRVNNKLDSFSEADFKYLNKNDIEDLYYLFQSRKVDNREIKLMNSLITFIRSCVIWERVHDFQLGIESYQIRVNLIAPTLTFPGIEEHTPYTIVDKPQTGLIYLNIKDEKRVMYLVEIVKFCDATLEKVLNEVKLRMIENKFLKKPPLVSDLDQDIMKAYEREISNRLSHRQQMRRWESFVNGRSILPTMKRL